MYLYALNTLISKAQRYFEAGKHIILKFTKIFQVLNNKQGKTFPFILRYYDNKNDEFDRKTTHQHV